MGEPKGGEQMRERQRVPRQRVPGPEGPPMGPLDNLLSLMVVFGGSLQTQPAHGELLLVHCRLSLKWEPTKGNFIWKFPHHHQKVRCQGVQPPGAPMKEPANQRFCVRARALGHKIF